MSWALLALLSALFAAFTAIFSKIGVRNIDSNLAVAIRISVALVLAWGLVLAQGNGVTMRSIPTRSWLFLVLSGLASGCSLLCYHWALQLAPLSRVAPIDKLSVALTIVLAFLLLGEPPTVGAVVGGALITARSASGCFRPLA